MATSAQMTPELEIEWRRAQKARKFVAKELEPILKADPSSINLARFDAVEDAMKKYRYLCISVIWADIQYASKEGTHEALWAAHVSVTKCYRNVIPKIKRADLTVLKRKLERLYERHLSTSHEFYKHFLQRFCARYHLQDLQRIVNKACLDTPVSEEIQIDAKCAGTSDIVNSIGHAILICLGDLTRYRTLVKAPERRSWEQALTFYALANDLDPESGFGHHQSSVIFTERSDHLCVMYHLYRSLSSRMPHPNAFFNLTKECKALINLRSRSSTGKDALLLWFVKLHAFLFKADETPQHKELVEEVLHRLGTTLAEEADDSVDDRVDAALLKMVLINICAYHVSLEKVNKAWSNEESRSCQLILQLNIHTIEAISRHIKVEAEEVRKTLSNDTVVARPGPAFPVALKRAVPLLRIYMTWLFSCRKDLAKFREFLQPYFDNMCETLNTTLGHVLGLVDGDYPYAKVVACQFSEDEETIGLACLNGPDLPDGCRLHFDPVEKKPKPRASEYSGPEFDSDQATYTRLIDIMNCALSLANTGFPLQWTCADPKTGVQQGIPVGQKIEANSPDSANPAGNEMVLYAPIEESCASEAINRLLDEAHIQESSLDGQADQPEQPPTEAALDNRVYQIVNDFLAPPEAENLHGSAEDTSYGMGSTTANDFFGLSESSTARSPASANARPFPTLPWEYFLSPTSGEGKAQGPVVGNGWTATTNNAHSSPSDTRHRGIPGGTPKDAWTNNGVGYPANPGKIVGPDMAAPFHHRGQVQDRDGWDLGMNNQHVDIYRSSFVSERPAGNGLAPVPNDPGNPQGLDVKNTTGSVRRASTHRPNFYDPGSFPSTLAFSEQTSTLPPLNSPWGVPRQTLGASVQDIPSTPARSFSSGSASATTVNTRPAATNPGLFFSNGHAYDATTAYGRGHMAQQESEHVDAVNFSATASALAAGKNAYNRQALQSAWDDSPPKPALPEPIGTRPSKPWK